MFIEIILYLLTGFSGIILFVHFLLGVAVLLNRIRDVFDKGFHSYYPAQKISVVVVARDEEETIPKLLESLEAQSFSNFDIVLVNDRSVDKTAQIMDRFQHKHQNRVKVIHNDQDPGNMNPKQFALDIAVAAAKAELLIFTDSDCVVPPGWVENIMHYFKNPRVGVVFGQISLAESGSFLKKYQAFDQPLIHQYSSGTAGMGMPGGCFGNNLAALKTVIEDIGGFKALGYTLTEDAALISAAGKKKWKVRVSTLSETMIETVPKGSWKDFIHQHVRWNTGAFYHSDLLNRFSYRFIVLYLVASILALPFSPFMPLLLILPATSFISIGILSLLSGLLYRRNKVAYLITVIPYTLFFMFFYSFITILSILRMSPEWKGRKLESTHLHR